VIASLAIDDSIKKYSQAERIDGRSTITLTFTQRQIATEELLAMADAAAAAVVGVRKAGCLFSCVSAAAAMGVSIEKTLEYLRDRQQFGVSLSTFQALRHYMAQVYAKYECYRALVRTVVIGAASSGEIDDHELSLLKVYLSQVGRFTAHTVLQVHGGMGMTEDLFASKLNKIVLMASMEYGDGQHHIDQVLSSRQSVITKAA
jgi:alkylation response protein AidB-like acyl-CoA dehydrogenase